MAIYILLLVIFFSGFLARLEKNKRFNLLKAVVMVMVEVVIGTVLFLLFIFIITKTFLNGVLISAVDSLFGLLLLIAVINGIILYWMNCVIIEKLNITSQVQTLCEYIIQWMLIYITVYQVVFDNMIQSVKELNIETLNITSPSDLIVLILPSLISVWIGIILYKTKKDMI